MKTTNTWPILEAVAKIEADELREALRAHGGSYHFCHPGEKGDGPGPCVPAYSDAYGPFSACVRSLKVKDGGEIALVVKDEQDRILRIYDDDVFAGHLSAITERIPGPEGSDSLKDPASPMGHPLYSLLRWPDSQGYVGREDVPPVNARTDDDDQARMLPVEGDAEDAGHLYARIDWPESQPWLLWRGKSDEVKTGFSHEAYVSVPVLKAEYARREQEAAIQAVLDGMTADRALETVFSLGRAVMARVEAEVLSLMRKAGATAIDFTALEDEDPIYLPDGNRVTVLREGEDDNVMVENADNYGGAGRTFFLSALHVGDAGEILDAVRRVIAQVGDGGYVVDGEGYVGYAPEEDPESNGNES